jgi:cytochrome c oxidase subunit 2
MRRQARRKRRKRCATGRSARSLSPAFRSGFCSSAGWRFIFFCSCRGAQLAEQSSNPPPQPLPDGIVPEHVVARTEKRWLMMMGAMLLVMMAIIVLTGIMGALHPSSNVEIIDPTTLHLKGEFVESNLGTAIAPDSSVTVRLIATQYDFVPHCVEVPAGVPVKFRITSADVVHGFLLPNTNVNTMVVPGFVAEVRTRFAGEGEYAMPCHEFCGLGHHAMWAHVHVVSQERFASPNFLERRRCERQ